ncbi:hypothetical protein V7x_54300 [Crateriforma conspicua]|uniref:Uncharacterized protein n=1 Tax=Crateriforma conspicua TaxID=2527996 RepID=A0A5C6FKI5_9PLAN|nr:hypothetical protein V7x_54300 [Crateriforma conspicua]
MNTEPPTARFTNGKSFARPRVIADDYEVLGLTRGVWPLLLLSFTWFWLV